MAVVDWLLGSDPAVRWQAMRDLTDADPPDWRPTLYSVVESAVDHVATGFRWAEELDSKPFCRW